MASIKLLLDKRSIRKDGTHPVKLYLTHKGGNIYINTSIYTTSEQWNNDQEKPTNNKIINSVLVQKLTHAKAQIYKLEASGKLNTLDIATLKGYLSSNNLSDDFPTSNTHVLVKDIFDDFITHSNADRTKDIYRQTLVKIGKYYDTTSLELDSIKPQWIRDFEQKMKTDGLSINAISVHLRNLRAVFNRAIDDELITNYPFRKFSIKTEKTRKRSLTVEQLRMLRDYPCQEYQKRYRDIFMLSFYLIGINMVDLCALKDIVNGRIEYGRSKTRGLYSIKIEPEALELIERYKGIDYLLDVCDNYANYRDFLKRVNKGLKEIGPMELVPNNAQDPKFMKKNKKKISPLFPELSTYWARHTWATIAASLDIPKETIAAALGHGGNSVTDIYIDFDQRKVDQANRRVIDYLLEK